ncbi:MAG: enoyl-CoA hydratase [Woeseiaceae bacterium]|nr:enoyl-CoA hydratase [Woeseiaceae bacterium]
MPDDRESVLLRDIADGVATLTLNRPRQRNALSMALLRELNAALADIADDKNVMVVVIRGNGPAFCAGHDLKEIRADVSEEAYSRTFRECAKLMTGIIKLPKPVIAQVHGIATAAGCQLVATCDLAIAADDARFATPGVNIGLFCSTPMVALSRNVGRKQAMEMLLTGEMIDADSAVGFGLVNRAVPADRLDSEVGELAALICEKSPLVVEIGKEAFYRQLEYGFEDAYEYTGAVMVKNMLTDDAGEGIDAFLEKRRPVWTGT